MLRYAKSIGLLFGFVCVYRRIGGSGIFFREGDFGNPSERRGSGLTGEFNLSVCELGRGHD